MTRFPGVVDLRVSIFIAFLSRVRVRSQQRHRANCRYCSLADHHNFHSAPLGTTTLSSMSDILPKMEALTTFRNALLYEHVSKVPSGTGACSGSMYRRCIKVTSYLSRLPRLIAGAHLTIDIHVR
ncbi:hypothetical protein BV22DRAFT_514288 [Leucogyrophana mollusca]|uniref:Uncharacterized protein n=1 Tax=Leucogyrophana mollusca TaxID=85980 RepID=A0ACB8BGA1_9AGAM|nr:hypothetical protein BV22DRAFT_514288 [Leucogyrophana mollusca]